MGFGEPAHPQEVRACAADTVTDAGEPFTVPVAVTDAVPAGS